MKTSLHSKTLKLPERPSTPNISASVRRLRRGSIFTSASQEKRCITIDGVASDTSCQEVSRGDLEKLEKDITRIHVYGGSKNAPKTSTPHREIFTSTSQKKRYITIAGIESDTSYREYQWPIFSIKDLNDNGDDFFKAYYPTTDANARKISTKVTIDTITKRPTNIIRTAVRNSNVNNYSVFQNPSGIFDYNSWGSTKRYQHRMTASSLGDFLKRILGMGYASWMNISSHSTQDDSFEDRQWDEPVILRFNRKEYRAFIVVVNGDIKPTRIEESTSITKDIGTDTEVEVALPLSSYWNNYNPLLDLLERYHRIWKLVKRNTEFSFSKEVI
jgi:hypothetical protein